MKSEWVFLWTPHQGTGKELFCGLAQNRKESPKHKPPAILSGAWYLIHRPGTTSQVTDLKQIYNFKQGISEQTKQYEEVKTQNHEAKRSVINIQTNDSDFSRI